MTAARQQITVDDEQERKGIDEGKEKGEEREGSGRELERPKSTQRSLMKVL